MTKKDLIKGILKLGVELDRVDNFEAVVVINEMELLVDKFIKENK